MPNSQLLNTRNGNIAFFVMLVVIISSEHFGINLMSTTGVDYNNMKNIARAQDNDRYYS